MRDFNDVTEQMNNIIDWYRNLSMDYTGINDNVSEDPIDNSLELLCN